MSATLAALSNKRLMNVGPHHLYNLFRLTDIELQGGKSIGASVVRLPTTVVRLSPGLAVCSDQLRAATRVQSQYTPHNSIWVLGSYSTRGWGQGRPMHGRSIASDPQPASCSPDKLSWAPGWWACSLLMLIVTPGCLHKHYSVVRGLHRASLPEWPTTPKTQGPSEYSTVNPWRGPGL